MAANGTPTLPEGAEQDEFNLGNSAAMTSAINAAVRDAAASGTVHAAETIAAARERAAQMLKSIDSSTAEGFRDLQNLTLSMGLPAARAVFRHMIVASGARGALKNDAQREVREFSPLTEVGCMKVDFHNKTTNGSDVAYLVLGECPKRHDLTRELDLLKIHATPEKWQEVLRHLSVLVNIGRTVYSQIAREHIGLIRKLFGLPDTDDCAPYLALQVDLANTTLFINADWPNRIGIYVRSEADAKGRDIYTGDTDEANAHAAHRGATK